MAWSNKKTVGQWNSQLIVEVVLNSQSGNSSNITVRIRLKNGGNSTALNNNGVSWSMSNGVSASGSDTFSIGAGATGTLASRNFTVAHNADGNKTISVTVNVGATGTSTFGTPGSLTVSGIKLPRIARVPSKPAKPTSSGITDNRWTVTLGSAPANNGAAITGYEWEVQNVDSGNYGTHSSSGRSWTRTGQLPNTRYRVRVRARNSVGVGPYSDWSATFRTKVAAPSAPSNVSATRVNDGRVNVGWTRHHTADRPYTSQRVQRRVYADAVTKWSAWTNIATVSGTATSFADSTTQANRAYQYRVVAVNGTGTATSGGAANTEIRMTPAAPTNVVAKKLANGNIQVSFKNASPYVPDIKYTIQDNPNGTGWVNVGTQTHHDPFVHTSPSAATHRYRVRIEDTKYNFLASAWSAVSNTVQLIAPPDAPGLVAPTGNVDRDEPIVFEWVHNPVDTTDQTGYELRYRVAGGSWTTLPGTTASTREIDAIGSSSLVEWQVRTKGAHASFGPWSAVASFNTVSAPQAVIQSPEETPIDVSRLTVEWAYQNDDSSGQSQWQVELEHNGEVVQSGSGSGSTSSYVFPRSLADGEEYIVRVRVRSGTGLWSEWDSFTFETDFPLPYPVEVFPEWDRDTGSVSLTFEVDDSGDGLAPDWVTVERRDEGGDWVVIATELDPETSTVDLVPMLGVVEYRAVSWTELPTSMVGEVAVLEWEHGRDPIFVNAGPDFGHVARLIGDQITDSPVIEQASQEWAGWEFPTAVFGEGSSNTIQFTGQIIHTVDHDSSSVDEWKDLLFQRGVVCFRDCQGRKIFGLLGLGFSRNGPVTAVTITVDQVHYIEGLQGVPEPIGVDD